MQKRGARSRVIAATLIRCVVVLLLAVAIARPVWNRIGDGLTLVVLLDRSQSIPRVLQDQSIETLTEWTNQKHREKAIAYQSLALEKMQSLVQCQVNLQFLNLHQTSRKVELQI
jgi:hypothetical protein